MRWELAKAQAQELLAVQLALLERQSVQPQKERLVWVQVLQRKRKRERVLAMLRQAQALSARGRQPLLERELELD
jgi:hypothetical protein